MIGGTLYPQSLTSWPFIIVLSSVVAFVILAGLALRSGHGYSPHDTEAHAVDYANVIREGHGGMTAFLWVTFTAILFWMIFYLVQRWGEFSRLFATWS